MNVKSVYFHLYPSPSLYTGFLVVSNITTLVLPPMLLLVAGAGTPDQSPERGAITRYWP